MKQLAALRTNMSLVVKYENGELIPTLEMIFICVEPEYQHVEKADDGTKFEKFAKVSDTRMFIELNQIDELIAVLEETKKNMQVFS
jgi:hypothetical protein